MTGSAASSRCALFLTARYKLSLNLLSQDEFYDLQEDPLEMVNRIDDPACYERICRLHDAILDNMNRTRDPFPRLLLAPPPVAKGRSRCGVERYRLYPPVGK